MLSPFFRIDGDRCCGQRNETSPSYCVHLIKQRSIASFEIWHLVGGPTEGRIPRSILHILSDVPSNVASVVSSELFHRVDIIVLDFIAQIEKIFS